MYERILVGLDGSQLAERVLPYVEALAEKFGSRLVLVEAVAPIEVPVPAAGLAPDLALPMDFGEIEDEERQAARRYLGGVATRLRERGRTVELLQPEGDPAAVLLEQARTLNADLIALTTHGRSGLSRLFYGSVAEAVLHEAPCPVLLVRTHEDGAS
jgi:nucleotide-binding universal stress UspA family protein